MSISARFLQVCLFSLGCVEGVEGKGTMHENHLQKLPLQSTPSLKWPLHSTPSLKEEKQSTYFKAHK
jgi:hypothetical protein